MLATSASDIHSMNTSQMHFPTFQTYMVFETRKKLYICGGDADRKNNIILIFDRSLYHGNIVCYYDDNGAIYPTIDDVHQRIQHLCKQHNNHFEVSYQIYGLMGVIAFQRHYVVAITENEDVGSLLGCSLYRIKSTSLICINTLDLYIGTSSTQNRHIIDTQIEQNYIDLFTSFDFSNDFYYSYQYDLSNSLQTTLTRKNSNNTNNHKDGSSSSPSSPSSPSNLISDHYYTNNDIDNDKENILKQQYIPHYHPLYTWNNHLARTLAFIFPTTLVTPSCSKPHTSFADYSRMTFTVGKNSAPSKASLDSASSSSSSSSSSLDQKGSIADIPIIFNLRSLQELESHPPDTSLPYQYALSRWIPCVISGYIAQTSFKYHEETYVQTLIARRGLGFAGTRYIRRGICNSGTFLGAVANEVETELITSRYTPGKPIGNTIPLSLSSSSQDSPPPPPPPPSSTCFITSGLLYRGSIPLLWKQVTNFSLAPNIVVEPPIDANLIATEEHYKSMLARYHGRIHCMNLIKSHEKKPREGIIGDAFLYTSKKFNKKLSYQGGVDELREFQYSNILGVPNTVCSCLSDTSFNTTTTTTTSPDNNNDNTSIHSSKCSYHPLHAQIPFHGYTHSVAPTPPYTPTHSDHLAEYKAFSQGRTRSETAMSPQTSHTSLSTTTTTAAAAAKTTPSTTPSIPDIIAMPQPSSPLDTTLPTIAPEPVIASYLGSLVSYHAYDFLYRNSRGHNVMHELSTLSRDIVSEHGIFSAVLTNIPSLYTLQHNTLQSPFDNHGDIGASSGSEGTTTTTNADTAHSSSSASSVSRSTLLCRTAYDIYCHHDITSTYPFLVKDNNLVITSLQQGISRINCIDCCDRTNVTCYIVCKEILIRQLATLESLSYIYDGMITTLSPQSFIQPLITPLIQILQHTFTEHGDAISRRYTGTGAMHKDLLFVKDQATLQVYNKPMYYPRYAPKSIVLKTNPVGAYSPYMSPSSSSSSSGYQQQQQQQGPPPPLKSSQPFGTSIMVSQNDNTTSIDDNYYKTTTPPPESPESTTTLDNDNTTGKDITTTDPDNMFSLLGLDYVNLNTPEKSPSEQQQHQPLPPPPPPIHENDDDIVPLPGDLPLPLPHTTSSSSSSNNNNTIVGRNGPLSRLSLPVPVAWSVPHPLPPDSHLLYWPSPVQTEFIEFYSTTSDSLSRWIKRAVAKYQTLEEEKRQAMQARDHHSKMKIQHNMYMKRAQMAEFDTNTTGTGTTTTSPILSSSALKGSAPITPIQTPSAPYQGDFQRQRSNHVHIPNNGNSAPVTPSKTQNSSLSPPPTLPSSSSSTAGRKTVAPSSGQKQSGLFSVFRRNNINNNSPQPVVQNDTSTQNQTLVVPSNNYNNNTSALNTYDIDYDADGISPSSPTTTSLTSSDIDKSVTNESDYTDYDGWDDGQTGSNGYDDPSSSGTGGTAPKKATRMQKLTGMATNVFTAAKRYYKNNMSDHNVQFSHNLVLGYYIPQHRPRGSLPLWDIPATDIYNDSDIMWSHPSVSLITQYTIPVTLPYYITKYGQKHQQH